MMACEGKNQIGSEQIGGGQYVLDTASFSHQQYNSGPSCSFTDRKLLSLHVQNPLAPLHI